MLHWFISDLVEPTNLFALLHSYNQQHALLPITLWRKIPGKWTSECVAKVWSGQVEAPSLVLWPKLNHLSSSEGWWNPLNHLSSSDGWWDILIVHIHVFAFGDCSRARAERCQGGQACGHIWEECTAMEFLRAAGTCPNVWTNFASVIHNVWLFDVLGQP